MCNRKVFACSGGDNVMAVRNAVSQLVPAINFLCCISDLLGSEGTFSK